MIDILRERNTFLTASTGTEVRDSLINLIMATNDGWVLGCDDINAGMSEIKSSDELNDFFIIPEMQVVGESAFSGCPFLSTIAMKSCRTIENSAFANCTILEVADFPVCTTIASNAFANCTSLTSLTLEASSVCSLASVDAFAGTPIASGAGFVYVPETLISDYISDSVWSLLSSRILVIGEEYAGEEEAVET